MLVNKIFLLSINEKNPKKTIEQVKNLKTEVCGQQETMAATTIKRVLMGCVVRKWWRFHKKRALRAKEVLKSNLQIIFNRRAHLREKFGEESKEINLRI